MGIEASVCGQGVVAVMNTIGQFRGQSRSSGTAQLKN
jgi:hypothetical protein